MEQKKTTSLPCIGLMVLAAVFTLVSCNTQTQDGAEIQEPPKNICPPEEEPAPCGPLPSERQLELMDMEAYAFLHYSLNTYTDQEWGYGNESLTLFNPEGLDAGQWARTCKEAGLKGIIFTAKHHGGFCMWPSEYTEYSVKNTPWKGGKGDVVAELAEACRKEGLKFAVYLSPWDRNHADYARAEYVTYFRNQLTELLTNYGDIFEVWFDGANGGNGWYGGADEIRTIPSGYYGWDQTFALVRSLQKDICIWGSPEFLPDLTWCGNEAGYVEYPQWSIKNPTSPSTYYRYHGKEDGTEWIISESDVSIRPGWFYHTYEDSKVKTLEKLMDIYYKTVGRNGTLLLNFPITKEGLIHKTDSTRGSEFRQMVESIFSNNLAKGAKVSATNVRDKAAWFAPENVIDNYRDTYWATDEGVNLATLTLEFDEPVTFNRFMVEEYVKLGQRVKDFTLVALVDGEWVELKDSLSEPEDGTQTIGRKRIVCFPEVTATTLQFIILDSKDSPLISNMGIYYAPQI
ncbi:MAG: alpha-L-fucosidase [Candidatus Cryptobacteroides sp.]